MNPCSFRYAKLSDDSALKEVLLETPMQEKGLSIRVQIEGILSEALSKDRNSDVQMIIFEDENGRAAGMASLTRWDESALARMGLVSSMPVYYLGDLRIRPDASRTVRVEWRTKYRELIDELSKDAILLTSILNDNRMAQLALRKGRNGIHYEPVLSYSTVTVLNPMSIKTDLQMQSTKQDAMIKTAFDDFKNSAIFQTELKRTWNVTENGKTFNVKPIVLKELNTARQNISSEQLRALSLKACTENSTDSAVALQFSAHQGEIQIFRDAFADLLTIETPATLYQVTSSSGTKLQNLQVLSRTCLDSTIL